MPKRRKRVRDLAREAGLDVDEALVTLWESGFDEILSPEDFVRSGGLNRARRALGLATRREIKDPGYWKDLLNLDEARFSLLLTTLGIKLGDAARRLPRKAVTRLKAEARRVGVDPLTGVGVPQPVREEPLTQRLKAPEQWFCPGHKRDLRWLTYEEVEAIHEAIAEDFAGSPDPIKPVGVRSRALLGSAVFRPQTSLGSVLKYPTVEGSAAALLSGIVHDHPFHNGNKRTALVAMLVFLDANGFIPTCDEDELFKLLLQLAQHRIVDAPTNLLADKEVVAVAQWLSERVRAVETGNHPIAFRTLRSALASFNCQIELSAGNKANISREIVTRNRLGIRRRVKLKTQVHYHSEGREVGKSTLKKIREDLELDEVHSIDSLDFYGAAGTTVTEFIANYRKTLRRLAKL
jgi:death-on-curing family protein